MCLQGTEKAFVQRCKDSLGKHSSYLPHKGDALVFTIKHYAGDVSLTHTHTHTRAHTLTHGNVQPRQTWRILVAMSRTPTPCRKRPQLPNVPIQY